MYILAGSNIQSVITNVQTYDGQLSFATDAWTSPNHRSYVALTVHLAHEGKPLSFILDVVEVAMVHYTSITISQD